MKPKGISIILKDKKIKGVDPFGKEVFEELAIEVDNVLVAPASTEDITHQLSLTGKKAVYTLGIPKGDENDWINKEVIFFGRTWRTVGIPQEGIEDLVPLAWNKKVLVEAYE